MKFALLFFLFSSLCRSWAVRFGVGLRLAVACMWMFVSLVSFCGSRRHCTSDKGVLCNKLVHICQVIWCIVIALIFLALLLLVILRREKRTSLVLRRKYNFTNVRKLFPFLFYFFYNLSFLVFLLFIFFVLVLRFFFKLWIQSGWWFHNLVRFFSPEIR